MGAVILPRQLFSHSASACYLLELGYQPFDIIGGLGTRIGVSILCPSADTPQSLVGEGVGHCVGFTQIPRFQFLADDANQRVLTPTSSTSLAQPLLQGQAIAIVVISHNNEPGTRFPPISQCVGDIAVKVLLPFVQDDCKVGQEGLQREGDERWECVDMGAEESLFQCLEQVPDPRKARGVRHPFQAILRLTLLGLVCGQTTMAHIALFAKMHWPVLREPLGFLRDDPPHATTISRTLAGVPCEQLQGALTGWVARVAADQELDASVDASVDGKWAKQSEDAQGNPLVMVNVLAHGLKLCLAQWPASEKRYEPRVLREQLGRLFEDYPGLRLLTRDALYAERDLCQAIVDHGPDYLVRVKGNQPTVLAALTDGFAPEELGEPQAETLEKKRV